MTRLNYILSLIYLSLLFFPLEYLNYFMIFLVLYIGMPHGAYDFFTLKRLGQIANGKLVIAKYLFAPFLAWSIWRASSDLFWGLFFITSFLHFFKVELEDQPHTSSPELAFFSIFCLPGIFPVEFSEYMIQLGGEYFSTVLVSYFYFFLMLYLTIVTWRLLYLKKSIEYFFWVSTFFLCMFFGDLMSSFMYYFLLLHSRKHLMSNPDFSIRNYLTLIMPISVILVVFAIFFFDFSLPMLSIILFLSFLTFPHFYLDVRKWSKTQLV